VLNKGGNNVATLRCVPHVLNLIVGEGLKTVSEPLKKLKAQVQFFHKSTTACDQLQKKCKVHNEKYLKPQGDVPTRWNSTYKMIASMVAMKVSVSDVIKEHDKGNLLSQEDWTRLEAMLKLLRPFEVSTRSLSQSSTCTLSMVTFTMTRMSDFLEKKKDLKDLGVPAMQKKLAKYRDFLNQQSLLPSFLDPRYFGYLTSSDRESAIASIKKMLIPTHEAQEPNDDIFELKPQAETRSEGYPELSLYLSSIKLDIEGDPLSWWKTHEKKFPAIAAIARVQLSKLASSVPSEEAFSAAGQMISDRRANLDQDTAEALMLTRSWLRFQKSK